MTTYHLEFREDASREICLLISEDDPSADRLFWHRRKNAAGAPDEFTCTVPAEMAEKVYAALRAPSDPFERFAIIKDHSRGVPWRSANRIVLEHLAKQAQFTIEL